MTLQTQLQVSNQASGHAQEQTQTCLKAFLQPMTDKCSTTEADNRSPEEKQTFVFIAGLFICQPFLDFLSFGVIRLGWPSLLTTGLRALVLVSVLAYSLQRIPHKRKLQVVGVVLLVLFWVLHYYSARKAGIGVLGADLNQYVKTAQLPLFILSFYALFTRFSVVSWKSFCQSTTAAFWLILLADFVAWLTRTGRPTYVDLQVGFLGWYHVANAQSIIIAFLFPLALYTSWQWFLSDRVQRTSDLRQQLRLCLARIGFLLTALAGAFRLYFFATRITYASIFTTVIALLLIFILHDWKHSLFQLTVLLLLGVSAYVLLPYSPMFRLRADDVVISESQQKDLEKELNLNRELKPVEHDLKILAPVYQYYLPDLVQEFGLEEVAAEYGYSAYFIDLRNVRNKKIHFANLRMRQMPSYIRWTGLNFASMQVVGIEGSYDLETDPPAIYYYTGYIGVAFSVVSLFLLLFGLVYILYKRGLLACLRDARLLLQGYLFLLLAVAAATGGSVLRRPSVSIYLAFIVAFLFIKTRQVQQGK